MKNCEVKIDGNKLTLTVDLAQAHGPSKSGKTTVVASTEGNVDIEGHPGFKLGVNIFKPRS